MSDERLPRFRILSAVAGLGMVVASALTIQHYFAANFPVSIFEGSFCDISAFFNCDSSAYSEISAIRGVPLGYFGAVVGGLFVLGAVFPSERLERTNATLSLLNVLGVLVLLVYSLVVMRSLCLLCAGYYLFSFLAFMLFALHTEIFVRPSATHLGAFAVVTGLGAYGYASYHDVKEDAQTGGVAARIVEQYFSLPTVALPSVVSPYMVVQSAERFQDAPVRIVEYGDLLCSDCQILYRQIARLREEFPGKLNVAFQFFPLDAACNDVVEKDKHPGACDLSHMLAYAPDRFHELYSEVFENLQAAKAEAWRDDFARRHGLRAALTDSATRAIVQRLIQTGAEYEKTHEEYSHGIRSTPTMILNERMVIGTFPYAQLRAIVQALVDKAETGKRRFMENWIE